MSTAINNPAKKRHVFRWFFLAVQLLFLIWLIAGINSTADNCDGEVGSALEACQAGTAIGGGIAFAMIIGLWLAVDAILAVTYLIFRKK